MINKCILLGHVFCQIDSPFRPLLKASFTYINTKRDPDYTFFLADWPSVLSSTVNEKSTLILTRNSMFPQSNLLFPLSVFQRVLEGGFQSNIMLTESMHIQMESIPFSLVNCRSTVSISGSSSRPEERRIHLCIGFPHSKASKDFEIV